MSLDDFDSENIPPALNQPGDVDPNTGAVDSDRIVTRMLGQGEDQFNKTWVQRPPKVQKPQTDFTQFGKTKDELDAEPAVDFTQFGQEAPEEKKPDEGIGFTGNVKAAGKAAAQGAISGVGSAMQGAGVAMGGVTPANSLQAPGEEVIAPFDQGPDASKPALSPQDNPVYKAGGAVKKFAQENISLTDAERESLGGQFGSAVGGGAAAIGAAFGGAAIGGPLLGIGAGMAAAGLQGAGDTYEQAKSKGADDDTALKAAGVSGAVNGAMMGLPIGTVLSPIKRFGPGLTGWVLGKLAQFGANGGVFTAVGEAQHEIDTEIAHAYYDPDAKYDPSLKRAMGEFLAGGMFGLLHPLHGDQQQQQTQQQAQPNVGALPGASAAGAGDTGAGPGDVGAGAGAGAPGSGPQPGQGGGGAGAQPGTGAPGDQWSQTWAQTAPPAADEQSGKRWQTLSGIMQGQYGFRPADLGNASFADLARFMAAADALQANGVSRDAIRSMTPADMAKAVADIQGGAQEQNERASKPGTRQNPVNIQTAADVARATAMVDEDHTGPQGEANNIQRGHAVYNGIPLVFETGSNNIRRGTVPDTGETWEQKTGAPYGYIPGTKGADGQALDFFMGEHPSSPTVFVLDETDQKTGDFKQHKVFFGTRTPQDAYQAYINSSGKSPSQVRGIAAMSIDQFNAWKNDPKNLQKPVTPEREASAQPNPKSEAERQPAGMSADTPSAEPLSDIMAQRADLADPKNPRNALWLPATTVEHLARLGRLDEVIGSFAAVHDFDGRGGILIAKTPKVARAATEDRAAGRPLQAIVGRFTGAGTGKPVDATHVVQQVDDQGNVTRERAVNAKDVQKTATAFSQNGRGVAVLTPEQVIQRRADIVGKEAGPDQGREPSHDDHHAVVDVLQQAGINPADVRPADIARAGEIAATEGMTPAEAFPVAVLRSLVEDGHISPEALANVIGKDRADAILASSGGVRGGRRPRLEEAGAAARGQTAEAAAGQSPRSNAPGEGQPADAKGAHTQPAVAGENDVAAGTETHGGVGGVSDAGHQEGGRDGLRPAGGERDAESERQPGEIGQHAGEQAAADGKDAAATETVKTRTYNKPLSLLEYIGKRGGLKPTPDLEAMGLTHRSRVIVPVQGYRNLVRRDGMSIDNLIENLREGGYIERGPDNRPDDVGVVAHVMDLIDEELRGNKQYPIGAEPPKRVYDEQQEEFRQELEKQRELLHSALDAAGYPLHYLTQQMEERTVRLMREKWVQGELFDPLDVMEAAAMSLERDRDQSTDAEYADLRVGDEALNALDQIATPQAGGTAPQEGRGPEESGGLQHEEVLSGAGEAPRGAGEGAGQAPEVPATEKTPAGEQHVIPGAEQVSDAELAQVKADEKLKPKVGQKAADEGLFGDSHQQADLVDMARHPKGEEPKAEEGDGGTKAEAEKPAGRDDELPGRGTLAKRLEWMMTPDAEWQTPQLRKLIDKSSTDTVLTALAKATEGELTYDQAERASEIAKTIADVAKSNALSAGVNAEKAAGRKKAAQAEAREKARAPHEAIANRAENLEKKFTGIRAKYVAEAAKVAGLESGTKVKVTGDFYDGRTGESQKEVTGIVSGFEGHASLPVYSNEGGVLFLTPDEIKNSVEIIGHTDKDEAESAEPAEQAEIQSDAKAPEKGASDSDDITDLVGETGQPDTLETLKQKLAVFASGMSRISDLETGTRTWGGFKSRGIGVDVGELTVPSVNALARAVVDHKAQVFVDSGAFSAFRRKLRDLAAVEKELGDLFGDKDRKPAQFKALDFDAILKRYDEITEAIGKYNEAEEAAPKPMLVMPDIVGDQQGSLDLIDKYKNWIATEAKFNVSQPIVPIQKGKLTLAEAYKKAVEILGTDRFIVGVPSNEKAVTNAELKAFLEDARPTRIHFLGSASAKNLEPKLKAIAEAGLTMEHLSADANILRSALYGKPIEEGGRQAAIKDTLWEHGKDEGEKLVGEQPERESEKVGMLEDAGEKIGGARKDQWIGRGLDLSDLEGMTGAERAGGDFADEQKDFDKSVDEASNKNLADAFANRLQKGEGFANILAARRFAKEHGHGDDPKIIEEALEQGVVKTARNLVAAGADSPEAMFKVLVNLYGLQPKLGTRTSTSVREQAYSTPVPLAFLASRLAGITGDTTVYEPTAGNGALLIEANPENTTANEINPERAKALKDQGFVVVTQADATEFAPKPKTMDVVIANPPFGAVREGGESKVFDMGAIQPNYRTHEIDHAIALKALGAMKDNGRGVLILGGLNKLLTTREQRSDGYQAKAKREFYKVLYENYNVADHFTVAGELYERQGAGWPVDVVVIHGRGKSARPLPAVDVPRIFNNWDALEGLLNGLQPVTRNEGVVGASDAGASLGGAEDGSAGSDVGGGEPVGEQRLPGGRSEPGEPGDVQSRPVSDGGAGVAGGERDQGQSGPGGSGDTGGSGAAHAPERRPSGLTEGPKDEFDEAFDKAFEKHFGDEPKTAAGGGGRKGGSGSTRTKSAQDDELEPRRQKKPGSERTAGDAARDAANNTADAADAAFEALYKLFGGKNKTSAGFTFDKETYEQAKPYFKAAAEKFRNAWGNLGELVDKMLGHMRDALQWTGEIVESLKPYLRRFMQEVRQGIIKLGSEAEQDRAAEQPQAKRAAPKQEQETENQVAYRPKSDVTGLGTLVPVNMRNSIAESLRGLEARVGNVDVFVAKELGYDRADLEKYFGAEQVDAIGLALDNLKDRKGFIIGDQTGIGKGRSQPLDAMVLTPKGFVPMGALRRGDAVVAQDGKPAAILQIFPQGELDVYRVTFSDGAQTECSADHLWATQTRNQRRYAKLGKDDWGRYRINTAEQLMQENALRQVRSIPLTEPVAFGDCQVPLDPYLVGAMIGDGHIRKLGVQIVLGEQEMVDLVSAALPGGMSLKKVQSRTHHYAIVNTVKRHWRKDGRSPVLGAVRELGLHEMRAANKAIPAIYKINSPGVRLSMLQGLMDTDGECGKQGACAFNTVSPQLANDVVFLVRSLGGIATRSVKKAFLNGKRHKDCHRIFIKMPSGVLPFRLRRKADRVRAQWVKYPPARYIKSIERTGRKQCQCILIDHPSHLYVTDDFIVTHNTNAAIIRWAIKNGRVPVFVTEKPNLYADMYRDLDDIGISDGFLDDEPRILTTNSGLKLPLSEDGKVKIGTGDGKSHNALLNRLTDPDELRKSYDMVFTNYSQLQTVKGEDTVRRSFLNKLANSGDGIVLILDESHNAGGQTVERKKADAKTNRAEFARDLVKKAKGVFYSSATYAKRPDVMDLYAATDMAMAVDDISKLAEAISKGGVPMQQAVASMLAKAGQYIRRERSFAGVTYDTPLVSVPREQYDQISHSLALIQDFSAHMKDAVAALNEQVKAEGEAVGYDGSTGDAGASSTNFTAVMHNLINQMLLSMKARPAVDEALAALSRGEKPVLTVANTMESFLSDYASEVGIEAGDAMPADFSDVVMRYLKRTRTVLIKKPFAKKGESERKYLADDELSPMALSAFREAADIISRLELSELPMSPIDHIKSELEKKGYKVGEITGRGTTIDYSGDEPILRNRPTTEMSIRGRKKMNDDFNSGALDAIVLNQAGSTGISLHASERFKDQRQRHMIIVQPEANIDTHMQMLGRVHRTGQIIVPKYSQLVADIPAEKRPAAVLSKKMASLNANTTASRGGALTGKDVPDFINEYGDAVAVSYLNDNPEMNVRLADAVKFTENGFERTDAMRRLTGRIPLLPLKAQEEVYEHLEAEYAALLAQMEAAGENALEAKTLDLKAQPVEMTEVVGRKNESGSPFAEPVYMVKAMVSRLGKPFSPNEVMQRVADALGMAESEKLSDEEIFKKALQSNNLHATAARPDALTDAMSDPRRVFGEHMARRIFDYIEGFKKGEAERKSISDMSLDELGAALEDANGAVPHHKATWGPRSQKLEHEERTAQAQEYDSYKRGIIDGIPDPAKAEKERTKLDAIKDRWVDAHQTLPIGKRIYLKTNSGNITAIVTGIDKKGEPKNPLALGAWKAHFAIADASRTLTLPFSRLYADGKSPKDDPLGVEMAEIPNWIENATGTLDRFAHMQTESKEERYIATGNLLAAYDWLNNRGRIMHYTDSRGRILQGILTAKDFKLDKHAEGKGRAISDSAEIKTWLEENFNKPLVAKENAITLRKDYSGYTIATEKSKKTGGVFYLDPDLTGITGDFYSRGGQMQASVSEGRIKDAIKRIIELGAKFTGESEKLKTVKVDEPTADESAARAEIKPVAPDAQPSRGLTDAAEAQRQQYVFTQKALRGELQRELTAVLDHITGGRVSSGKLRLEFPGDINSDAGGYGSAPMGAIKGEYIPVLDLIKIALSSDAAGNPFSLFETAVHEGSHFALDHFATDQERALLRSPAEMRRMAEYIAPRLGIPVDQAASMAPYEIEAHAAQFYIGDRARGANAGAGLHIGIRRFFERLFDLFRRIRAWLNGKGFNRFEDVFDKVYSGEMGQRESRREAGEESKLRAEIKAENAARAVESAASRVGDFIKDESGALNYGALADKVSKLLGSDTAVAAVEKLSDYSHRIKLLQDDVEALYHRWIDPNGDLPDKQTFYDLKRLFPGKRANGIAKVDDDHVKPLIKFLHDSGIQSEDAGEYLYARHAVERNRELGQYYERGRQFNEALRDPDIVGASGMSSAEAQRIRSAAETGPKSVAYAELVQKAKALNRAIQEELVRSGLESQSTVATWNRTYTDYVPLQGWNDEDDMPDHADKPRTRGGGDVRGPEVRQAFGRKSRADNPLANLIGQAYRTVDRGEKNRVLVSMASALSQISQAMRLGGANTGIAKELGVRLNKGTPKPVFNKITGLIEMRDNGLDHMGENAVKFKVAGMPRYMVFGNPDVAKAAKTWSADQLHPTVNWMLWVQNKMKSMWTHYSPTFLARHNARYFVEGLLNSFELKETGAHSTLQYLKEGFPMVGDAARAIFAREAGKDGGDLGSSWDLLKEHGGNLSLMGIRDIDELKELLRERTSDLKRDKYNPMAVLHRATEALNKITSVWDNAQRLASFHQAIKQGMSPQEAAVKWGRDATVDYNLRGAWSNFLGLVQPFFNTALRTGLRLYSAQGRSGVMRKVFAGVLAMGLAASAWNYLVGGKDKDDIAFFDKLPEWERANSLMLMNPFVTDSKGRPSVIKFPFPYNWAAPLSTGYFAGNLMWGHDKIGALVNLVFKPWLATISQIGETGIGVRAIVPEVVRPAYDIGMNKTWTGAPIHQDSTFQRAPNSWSGKMPINGQVRTGEGWKAIAKFLNGASGGDRGHSGYLDFYPEDIRYVFNSFLGQQSTLVQSGASFGNSLVHGEAPDPNKVPMGRPFIGQDYDAYDRVEAAKRFHHSRHPWERQ